MARYYGYPNNYDLETLKKCYGDLVYYTEELKSHYLDRLNKYIDHAINGIDFEGRDLKLDKLFIPYLNRINNLDGIVTTQSCSGLREEHNNTVKWMAERGEEWVEDGYISLLLKEHLVDKIAGLENTSPFDTEFRDDTRNHYKGKRLITFQFFFSTKDWPKKVEWLVNEIERIVKENDG